MKKKIIGWVILGIMIPPMIVGLAVLAFDVGGIYEGYCHLKPDIGTNFSKGYSEEKFDRITVGMSSAGVKQLLGDPLWNVKVDKNGLEWEWGYSQDKPTSGMFDFAWLVRSIRVSNDVVVAINKTVAYD